MTTQRELKAALAARDDAVKQAQQHAMEARTQRGTVLDILRHFGCQEEDWRALELIKAATRPVAAQKHGQAVQCHECDGRGFTYWGEGSPGNGFDVAPEPPEQECCQVCGGSGKEPPEGPLVAGNAQAALSDEQIGKLWKNLGGDNYPAATRFARAILAASQQPAAAPAAPAIQVQEGMVQANPHFATFPEKIWLQVGDVSEEETSAYDKAYRATEMTWSGDIIDHYDVAYVRADLAAAPAPVQPAPVADAEQTFSEKLHAAYAPRAILAVEPEPFILGNQYRTQGGRMVRFIGIANEGNSYETMSDELGHHRYTRRDFGRCTGAPWDDDCVPPLYTYPVACALAAKPSEEE